MRVVRFAATSLLVALGLASSQPVWGQSTPLVTYSTSGSPGAAASLPPTSVAPTVTASSITRVGLTPDSAPNSFSSTGFTTASTADPNQFLTFTVTTTQEGFDFNSLDLGVSRNNNGPEQFEVRTSLDNFATVVDTQTLTQTGNRSISFNLDSLDAVSTETNSVEFRIYGFAAGSTTDTFALTDNGQTPAVQLQGSPVPEPATVLGLATLGLAAAGFARRKIFA